MTLRLDGRTAIVTGAGAGLGRAHALLLAQQGAAVVVNDLGEAAETVADEIRAAGGRAAACRTSVADPESAGEIVQTALREFGRLDIVVNNAGILRDKSFRKMTLEDFELVLRVHLLGTVYVTHAAWPILLEQEYGRVVLTSSSSGLATAFGQANYGAAKAGMIGLMNSLKNEGARSNVKVNAIAPVAATQMTTGLLSDRLAEISVPEHVSPAVAWLCSEACDVTGEILALGAGHYARVQLLKGPGVTLDPDRPCTPEEFAAHLTEVFSMEGAEPYAGALDARTRKKLGLA